MERTMINGYNELDIETFETHISGNIVKLIIFLLAIVLTLMQLSMDTLNSSSSRVVKDSASSRHRILRCINFGIGESSPNLFLNMMNLYLVKFEAQWILNDLLFDYFVYLKVNLDLERKNNQMGESSPNSIIAAVNLDPVVIEKAKLMVNLDLTILLKRWTEVKTWGG